MTGPVSLVEKIQAVLEAEQMIVHVEKAVDAESLSERESGLVDWGAIYGLAYGIARAENPFESHQNVAQRAFMAAHVEFERWAGFAPGDCQAQEG